MNTRGITMAMKGNHFNHWNFVVMVLATTMVSSLRQNVYVPDFFEELVRWYVEAFR